MIMQIFRVEHKETRVGPFQSDYAVIQHIDFIDKLCNEIVDHLPLPSDDGISLKDLPHSYVFGCQNLETLKKWVLIKGDHRESKRNIRKLKALGFILSEYNVEKDYKVGSSGIQVVFDPSDLIEPVIHHNLSILL